MNNTMTRVNGIFENDFAARMILIANNDDIIYTDASTDPYSQSSQMNNWNLELMNTLSVSIGNNNFDIGHLFGRDGGGGNAGCIGCICDNDMSTYQSQGVTNSGRIMIKGSHHIFFDINNAYISLRTSDSKPTAENPSSTEIKMYPNPVKDILTLTNTSNEEYKIYDMSGRLVSGGNLESGTVNVNKLTNGTYVIQIGGFAKQFIKK